MLYRERIVGKATGSSLTLFTKRIETGWQVTVEQICFFSTTVNNRDCNIYLEGHGYKHYLTRHTVEHDVSFRVDLEKLTLDDQERLAFEVLGLTAGDEVEVYLTGQKSLVYPRAE